ncbi:MAG: DUF402 domain-containing protein [Lachnospiraceae bacterium]|nr:DUF402 domain-containing protein [Lachnospiraceae bacterium]
MKKYRLTYDEWKCIKKKDQRIRFVSTDRFCGYIGVLEIKEVTEPQIWNYNGKDRIVCDKGIKWISILPKDKYYCITAMLDSNDEVIVWYIDVTADQGVEDDIPYFRDLYLDLIVYPDGTIITDDMDELEDALKKGVISKQLFQMAIDTKEELENTLFAEISLFERYTKELIEEEK